MHHKRWIASLACTLTIACCLTGTVQPAHAWTTQTLRYSSSGSEVREVQGRLKLLGFYHGRIDGSYGWRTYWAVRDFQYQFGMHIDGIVGEKTKAMLARATPDYHGPWTGQSSSAANSGQSTGGGSSNNSPSHNSSSNNTASAAYQGPTGGLSSNDIRLMAMLVYGEARGEPFAGQVGVADVILHRLKDPKFPHTVPGVIYQPGAFSAASNGQMDQVPNAEAFEAVHAAIDGDDPVQGALYYFNPAKTNNAYMWSRPEITKIGHHIFTM